MNQPVSTKELAGFYLFNAAGEPYFAAGMSVCMPLILEEIGRSIGNLKSSEARCEAKGQCYISVGKLKLELNSYILFVNCLSVILQTLVFISFSSMADYGSNFGA